MGTAVLRIRMAGGVWGGSENLPPARLVLLGCQIPNILLEFGLVPKAHGLQ